MNRGEKEAGVPHIRIHDILSYEKIVLAGYCLLKYTEATNSGIKFLKIFQKDNCIFASVQLSYKY